MGAIQIALFEGLKAYLAAAPDVDFDVNTLQAEALIGGLGGLVGALATVPTDVLTTRIITQTDDPPVGPRVMLKRILDEDGPSALFSGAAARGLYWTPAIGIFLSLYCSLRQAALGLI
jgi:solute carrier family 25 S-adenosylmethionine transporter 26